MRAEPAREVTGGDGLHIRTEPAMFMSKVLELERDDGPDRWHRRLYQETEGGRREYA